MSQDIERSWRAASVSISFSVSSFTRPRASSYVQILDVVTQRKDGQPGIQHLDAWPGRQVQSPGVSRTNVGPATSQLDDRCDASSTAVTCGEGLRCLGTGVPTSATCVAWCGGGRACPADKTCTSITSTLGARLGVCLPCNVAYACGDPKPIIPETLARRVREVLDSQRLRDVAPGQPGSSLGEYYGQRDSVLL